MSVYELATNYAPHPISFFPQLSERIRLRIVSSFSQLVWNRKRWGIGIGERRRRLLEGVWDQQYVIPSTFLPPYPSRIPHVSLQLVRMYIDRNMT